MKLKLLTPLAAIPTRATEGASCWDVFAASPLALLPGERGLVDLGFAVELPLGFELQIRPRSGLALKHGIVAHLGTIDSDYRGSVGVILFNHGQHVYRVAVGDRIAQMALCCVVTTGFEIAEKLSDTARGDGGFGHTGLRAP